MNGVYVCTIPIQREKLKRMHWLGDYFSHFFLLSALYLLWDWNRQTTKTTNRIPHTAYTDRHKIHFRVETYTPIHSVWLISLMLDAIKRKVAIVIVYHLMNYNIVILYFARTKKKRRKSKQKKPSMKFWYDGLTPTGLKLILRYGFRVHCSHFSFIITDFVLNEIYHVITFDTRLESLESLESKAPRRHLFVSLFWMMNEIEKLQPN